MIINIQHLNMMSAGVTHLLKVFPPRKHTHTSQFVNFTNTALVIL